MKRRLCFIFAFLILFFISLVFSAPATPKSEIIDFDEELSKIRSSIEIGSEDLLNDFTRSHLEVRQYVYNNLDVNEKKILIIKYADGLIDPDMGVFLSRSDSLVTSLDLGDFERSKANWDEFSNIFDTLDQNQKNKLIEHVVSQSFHQEFDMNVEGISSMEVVIDEDSTKSFILEDKNSRKFNIDIDRVPELVSLNIVDGKIIYELKDTQKISLPEDIVLNYDSDTGSYILKNFGISYDDNVDLLLNIGTDISDISIIESNGKHSIHINDGDSVGVKLNNREIRLRKTGSENSFSLLNNNVFDVNQMSLLHGGLIFDVKDRRLVDFSGKFESNDQSMVRIKNGDDGRVISGNLGIDNELTFSIFDNKVTYVELCNGCDKQLTVRDGDAVLLYYTGDNKILASRGRPFTRFQRVNSRDVVDIDVLRRIQRAEFTKKSTIILELAP